MKNLFLLLSAVVLPLLGYTQEVNEKQTSMSLGTQNSFYVDIPGADKKLCEKTFEDMTKSYGKIRENKKAKQFYLTQTRMAAINGSSPVDVYVMFEEGKSQATTYMWVDLGNGFVNSGDHPNQSKVVEQFMNDYYVEVRKRVVTQELKNEEKKQADLEKDLKKLREKKEDYLEEIEKCKQRIVEAEQNIEKNKVDQENKTKEIDGQKTVVKKVVDKLNSIGKKVE
jgi:hypothetical protein